MNEGEASQGDAGDAGEANINMRLASGIAMEAHDEDNFNATDHSSTNAYPIENFEVCQSQSIRLRFTGQFKYTDCHCRSMTILPMQVHQLKA
jgi:hypothetical protein